LELIKPDSKINFVGNRKYAYTFSLALTVLALLSFPVKGWVKLGIDFSGGAVIQIKFNKAVDTQQIRDSLEPLGENLTVQKFDLGGDEFMVRTDLPEGGAEGLASRVKELLDSKIGKGTVEIRGIETVGPKVGKDLTQSAIWATIVALGMLTVYVTFRFTFSMSIGATACLVHDVIMIYGIWAWTGREFNLTILAAVLTVIGYDINDTIVVCDRIRENLPIMRNKSLEEVLNISINQTLSRTILTSGVTLLVVVALLIFGTPVLKDFAWALFFGIVFGTYSSIFVATPLVLAWDHIIPVRRT
jgi:preprotein translocase subunit SecF